MAVFQFNLFCSKIPDNLLQSVFERFEIEKVDLKALRSEEWRQEWERAAHGNELEAELLTLFQQTNEFRGEKAQAAMQDAAKELLSESAFDAFREECLKLKNIHACLLQAWLIKKEIFEYACSLYVIDSIARSGWRLRTGIGNHEVDTSSSAFLSLSEAIRGILSRQMRGRFCEIKDVGQRGEKRLILAQISDYNETSDEFVRGEFTGRPRLPSRTLVFAYNALKGTLDVSTQGFGRVGDKFHEAFCQCILGLPELPKEKQAPAYCLGWLLKCQPDFVCAPWEAVKSCAVVGMQLRDCRLGKVVAINLTAPNNSQESSTQAIYDQLNRLFGTALQNMIELRSVTLQMKIKLRYGSEIRKNIRLSERGMQNLDFGEADEDIHAFLVANGLEKPSQQPQGTVDDDRA